MSARAAEHVYRVHSHSMISAIGLSPNFVLWVSSGFASGFPNLFSSVEIFKFCPVATPGVKLLQSSESLLCTNPFVPPLSHSGRRLRRPQHLRLSCRDSNHLNSFFPRLSNFCLPWMAAAWSIWCEFDIEVVLQFVFFPRIDARR